MNHASILTHTGGVGVSGTRKIGQVLRTASSHIPLWRSVAMKIVRVNRRQGGTMVALAMQAGEREEVVRWHLEIILRE